jgi:hypothetical protein
MVMGHSTGIWDRFADNKWLAVLYIQILVDNKRLAVLYIQIGTCCVRTDFGGAEWPFGVYGDLLITNGLQFCIYKYWLISKGLLARIYKLAAWRLFRQA